MAKTGIIIAVIIGILFIGLLITGFILVAQKGGLKKALQGDDTNLTLYLSAQDSKSKESISSNYVIEYKIEGIINKFSQGNLEKSSFTEIIGVPKDKSIEIYVWNNNHYLNKETKTFNPSEKINNVSKITLDLVKIGKLDIKVQPKLKEGINRILFNLTAKEGGYYKIGAVLAWTPGILDAYLEEDAIICKEGFWINYSEYNPISGQYKYLPENEYRCGTSDYETCLSVTGSQCYAPERKMPTRFLGKVDKTIYIGKRLNEGQTHSFILIVKTLDNINVLDYLDITFFDYDKRWNELTQTWTYVPELNAKDIGAEDVSVRIGY